MSDLLEKAIMRIKDLPKDRQDLAAELLLDFANENAGMYHLTADEVAEIKKGVSELDRGEGIDEADMLKFWRQTGVA